MVADLRVVVRRLEATVGELQATLVARDERIAELERHLEDARRRGKRQAAPFSKGAAREDPAPPGRKRGEAHGRHGHRAVPAGADRELDAPLPACCPHCGGEVEQTGVADQYQTDIEELPPAVTTRFRVGVGRCRDCGRRLQGRHRQQSTDALGAAGAHVGPRAHAWAAWAHYGLGLSFARCAQLLGRLGVSVTAGALCQGSQRTGTDLVPVAAQIRRRVNDAAMVAMDETGWRVGGHSAWVWVATSTEATLYDVADGRGFEEACRLVDEEYDGVIVRDGWAPYRRYQAATHQSCVAHLLRRCAEMAEDNPPWARGTPRAVAELLGDALCARDLSTRRRAKVLNDVAERVELLAAAAHPYDANRRLVAHLAKEAPALFSFLTRPGVDATNWRAEQAIRPAVVNRKVWGGNRTWRGAATQGRMMSVLRTAAQQGMDAIDYLTRLARAPTPAEIPPLFS